MSDRKNNMEAFLARWRGGELAHSSTTSTAALSLVLVLTLVAAQVLVAGRSGALIAQDDAGLLLDRVAERGLDQYLSFRGEELLYLLEDNGQAVGFGGYRLGLADGPEGERIGEGTELLYMKDALEVGRFTVANDLSAYRYEKRARDLQSGNVRVIQQDYRDGVLTGQVREGVRVSRLAPAKLNKDGVIAPFLIDLLSSLALQENYSKGVVFLCPKITVGQQRSWGFGIDQKWVRNSSMADLPEVVGMFASGHGGAMESMEGAGEMAQRLYFNDRHQLLWQMIPTARGRLIYRAVGRDEILKHFPDASAVLEQWRRGLGEDSEEAGHVLL